MPASVLGLDIGGANLKAATTAGDSRSQPFALWKNPSGLADALRNLLAQFSAFDQLAVTMTGELCDCFENKQEGVVAILEAVEATARDLPVRVWRNDGRFVDVATARTTPLPVAAANWLALATFAGRYAPDGAGILIDIGSTTTDIVPLWEGKSLPRGRTDPERLRLRELVYSGVRRTPLCSLLGIEAAAEFFATTLDVFLVLERIAESPADNGTADGKPATRAAAELRLARMLCGDLETTTAEERRSLAMRALQKQVHGLACGLDAVVKHLPEKPRHLILSGAGEFLAELVACQHPAFRQVRPVSIGQVLGPRISECACAYAVAMLAAETMEA